MSPPLPPLTGNPLLEVRQRLGPIGRNHPLRQQLVRRYAYGIPTVEALDAVAGSAPAGVVEIGAGTGYWARLLHDRGVDVVAYDRHPPERGSNRFVDMAQPWYPVQRGGAEVVNRHAGRTLLLVWPTWNESWAGDAVARYEEAGGHTVVYVGEGPGGRTGDASLHARLGIHGPCLPCTLGVTDAPCVCGIDQLWQLHHTVDIPRWGGTEDSYGIYHRHQPRDDRRVSPLRRIIGQRREPRP